jgi:hypothetical protein
MTCSVRAARMWDACALLWKVKWSQTGLTVHCMAGVAVLAAVPHVVLFLAFCLGVRMHCLLCAAGNAVGPPTVAAPAVQAAGA